MAWRGYRVLPFLAVIAAAGCDGHEPLAPLFMVVSAPGNLTATPTSFSQISLSWQDNSNSPSESGFEVHRSGTGPAGTFALVGTPAAQATGYFDAGLTGLTQYCYKVRAYRTTGHKTTFSDFSAVACATTPGAPVPAAPSGLTATPYLGYAIRATWTDNSTDENGFRAERGPSAAGPWTTILTLYPNTTVLTDYVAVEQPECYRVVAFNSYGDSDPSNAACTAVPAAPSVLHAIVVGTGVDLTWSDNSSVEDGFEVQRASQGEAFSVVANLDMNTTSYHDEPPPDNTYTYFVRAKKDGGTSGPAYSEQVVVAISPPSAPANLDAMPSGSNGVAMSWTDLTNETGFRVERSTDHGLSWVEAGSTGMNELSFGDYSVEVVSEHEVCYHVIAFNSLGESPASNSDCTTPPAAPTDFAAIAIDDYTVDLTWTDNSPAAEGYQVWVDDGYYGAYPVADLPAGTTSFQLVGYYAYGYLFGVAAVKDGGYSDFQWTYAAPPAGVARVRAAPPKNFHPPRQRKLTGH